MAAYSFSSLRDMLKQPSSQNSKLMEYLLSQPKPKTQMPHEDPYVTEMFGELYFKESTSSTLHFLFPPSSPSPSPSPSSSPLPNPTLQTSMEKLSDRTNLEKKMSTVAENGCSYDKRSLENEERLYPPPISCLKFDKSGKLFVYFGFDENSKEIRILTPNFLCASRENGRQKLNFAHKGEEEEEEEEGDNRQEADDEKEASEEECEGLGLCLCVFDK